MAYDNTNKGILGKNTRKTEDTHPPYSGNCNIDGVEYWVSAWIKQKKDNPEERFFSLVFKKKQPKPGQQNQPQDDSIPL